MTIDRPIVFFDTETATLSGAPHLLEIGGIRVEDGEVVDQFESLVAPAVEIEPEATEIHGITQEDIRSAPLAVDALREFHAWAGGDWLCAHNAGFDARVLGFEHARTGAEVPKAPVLCTLKLGKRHIPEAPDHKLMTLCQHLELDEGDHHRALADSVWCWQVLEACAERAETRSATELLGQCGTPVTIPAFVPGPARMKPRLRGLAEAVRNGDEVTILYGGADTGVPATLEVLPRLLYERHKKSYLEAVCPRTGSLKTFLLERVQKVLA